MIVLQGNALTLTGRWVLENLNQLNALIRKLVIDSKTLTIDGSGIETLDTSGGYRLIRWIKVLESQSIQVEMVGISESNQALIDLINERMKDHESAINEEHDETLFETIGRFSVLFYLDMVRFLAFIGQTSLAIVAVIFKPWTIRWKAFGSNLQTAGVDALPIVGLLNFLIGIVLAYQGGAMLKTYGANIFIVEMITISMLREMAPLITAIIVAGRTGSAFAAQIGTMSVNEEVDALRTIGINPINQLVLPKMFAMMIALPLLVLFADILSVFGGMVLAKVFLDISFQDFVRRIPEVISVSTLLVGIVKAPVFAIIIALTGCYQGFQVKGGADSVGQQTTIAVVQAIFLVIIVNAIFSILTRNIPI